MTLQSASTTNQVLDIRMQLRISLVHTLITPGLTLKSISGSLQQETQFASRMTRTTRVHRDRITKNEGTSAVAPSPRNKHGCRVIEVHLAPCKVPSKHIIHLHLF